MSISISIGQVLQGVGDWLTLTNKPTTFPPEVHGHAQADVTNLTTDLAAKVPTSRTINGQALSSNVTLTQDHIGDGSTNRLFTAAEKTKLGGIATSATANSADATLLARANHTGSQAISTITNLQTTLDGKAASSHTHTASAVTDFSTAADARITAQKGAANGLATLGADSKIPIGQLPSLVLTDVHVVASQAAQLALTTQEGDIAIRTDQSKTYVRNEGTAGTMADWNELLTPTDAVTSVNGQSGVVTLTKSDVGLSNVPNTDATARANHTGSQAISTVTSLQTTLDGKAPLAHAHVIGDITSLQTALDSKADTTAVDSAVDFSIARANHTGTQSADTIVDGTTNKVFTGTMSSKLAGIATAATVNSSDATLLNRVNHTGSQAISTITNLQTDLDARVPTSRTVNGLALSANITLNADHVDDTSTTHKFVTAANITKLNGIATSATANSTDAVLLARANHTGTQTADTITDGTTNKVFTATMSTKLAGIATSATANSSDATLLARANHTGTQSADTVVDGSTNKAFTAAEKTKLSGIANLATVNWPNADLVNRVYHTGTQSADTITDGTTNKVLSAAMLTNITAHLLTDALDANKKGWVNHGSNASMSRPSIYNSIEWYGSVEPTNAINGDTWINTA